VVARAILAGAGTSAGNEPWLVPTLAIPLERLAPVRKAWQQRRIEAAQYPQKNKVLLTCAEGARLEEQCFTPKLANPKSAK
jgi:hypothetical protein